jgi:DNA repair protein RadA/Sms
MPKKGSTVYVCAECGYESPKWLGQCICGAWNSFYEERQHAERPGQARARRGGANAPGGAQASPRAAQTAVPLRSVVQETKGRIDTHIGELNRVLGGGIMRGSLCLIAGEPGIGKSTLILQAALALAEHGSTVLYVSGEESEEQIRLRADRLTDEIPEGLLMLAETNIESILDQAAALRPALLITDSIQTMYSELLESAAGSVSQVRACTNELLRTAKTHGFSAFIVAHVTKSGDLAGPKIIEHLVDCVLQFTGDRTQDVRILRAQKNRYGTTSEIGAFEMREEGLAEIANLSGSLLDGMDAPAEGAIATAVCEGTRPLLLEMQALTAAAGPGFGRRTAIGVDSARLGMILAVLERKARLDLSSKDVYVNVVGGLKPDGTSTDLAAALAIWSSAKGVAIPPHTCAIGEIGLTGELRSVRGADKIATEAARLGFTKLILPEKSAGKIDAPQGLKLCGAGHIAEAIGFMMLDAAGGRQGQE